MYLLSLHSPDQSDADLRHSLANMVATVMGCPTRSNHLWYHLFAPEKLVNTYITGFMVCEPVYSIIHIQGLSVEIHVNLLIIIAIHSLIFPCT